jgi:hypothetical protein
MAADSVYDPLAMLSFVFQMKVADLHENLLPEGVE